MLCLSSFSPHLLFFQSYESIFENDYEIEEFDIWYDFKSDDDVQKIKRIFQSKGANAKKLFWANWSQHALLAGEVVELLNLLPNLEFVKFSSWNKDLTGETASESLELTNLWCIEIEECKNFIFDFLSTALGENKIKCLKVNNVREADAKFNAFIKRHPSIKRLNFSGTDYSTLDSLKDLKLERLRCVLYERSGETDNQRAYLKELIKSQPELTSLDLLNDMDYSFSFVDDDILTEISALSKLENLLINVDGISADGVKSLSSLSSLKNLEFKTNKEAALAVFQEFSTLKIPALESLVLKLWTFEISTETYTAIGANFENLKSLKITLGTRHKINFFAKAFSNLEDLSIKFGEANHPVEFSQAYDSNDIVKQSKLKKLHLTFHGSELIDAGSFFKFLEIFENLESLEMDSKFPFTGNFVNQLAEKLNTIKVLKLRAFGIINNEAFPPETTDAFKNLAAKLKYANLTFSNIQHVDFGQGPPDGEEGESSSFTFEPLVTALKGVYTAKETAFANIRIHNNLVLTAGTEE